VGAGAATLTAAALVLGPGTAVGTPTDPAEEVTQAAGEAIDAARQAAEDAAQAAEDAARTARDAADQATKAAEDAAEAAGDAARNSADTANDADINATSDETDWLPQDLQDDLADLQDMPADQRADEVQQIFRSAVTGEYGEDVENWTERMVKFMDALPQDLQDDLQNLVGMEPEAAHEQLQQIWQGVLDGDYGQDVEMWGKWLQQTFRQWNLGQLIEGRTDTSTTDTN
jgi:ABC-type transporter Mla subunit MlaD